MDEGNLSGIYPREDLNREVGVGDPTLEALDHQMGNGKTCPMHARHVWEKLTDLDRESTQGLRDRAALRVLPVQGRPDPHHALHPFLQQFKKNKMRTDVKQSDKELLKKKRRTMATAAVRRGELRIISGNMGAVTARDEIERARLCTFCCFERGSLSVSRLRSDVERVRGCAW